MSHLSELWRSFVIFGPIFAIFFGISGSSLFLGFTKYSECPYEPLLPQSLLVFGLIASLCSILALIFIVLSSLNANDSDTHLYYFMCVLMPVVVYVASAVIITSIIVRTLSMKSIEHQSDNPMNPTTFCHSSVYNYFHGFAATVIIGASLYLIWLMRRFICKYYHLLRNNQSIDKRR